MQNEAYQKEDIEGESLVVKGTKALQSIYARCNATIIEPTNFSEATKDTR